MFVQNWDPLANSTSTGDNNSFRLLYKIIAASTFSMYFILSFFIEILWFGYQFVLKMFLLFSPLCFSLRPVILIPGLYGSNLYATYDDFSRHWYCPKKLNNDIIWVNLKYVIPPTYNCLFEMMACQYNTDTKTIESQPGIKVDVIDFGGAEGVSYADKGIAGHHFFESFGPLFDYLKGKGYTVKKDLFGAPYDWRLAMAGIEKTLFPKLKALVEEAYQKNNNMAVVILGYSCGGFVLQRFFTTYVTQQWKDQYIFKTILMAPAFAGSSVTLDVAWKRYFPMLPFIHNDIITKSVENTPVLHALFPNHVVFGNDPIVIGPSGEKIIASQVPKFLIDNQKVTGTSIDMMMQNVEISKIEPKFIGVPTYILYNSGVDTPKTLVFNKGYGEDPDTLMTPGDGTVPAQGPEYVCNKWKSDKFAILCHDLKQGGDDFNHEGIGTNPYVHDLIFKAIIDSKGAKDWINKKGTSFVTSPLVKVTNNTYVIVQ